MKLYPEPQTELACQLSFVSNRVHVHHLQPSVQLHQREWQSNSSSIQLSGCVLQIHLK